MKFTEDQLVKMASPISKTEEEKCKNAIHMVRDAMKLLDYTDNNKEIRTYITESYSYALDLEQKSRGKNLTLLVQGSYANRTNIPSESDVDVAVILESSFTTEYRPGVLSENYKFSDATFTVEDLKDEVLRALQQHFRYEGVERHDKSIKVTGNTYRVDADVVPAYRFRDYTKDYEYRADNYIGGIEIRPDKGGRIINYPEQHIKNGVEKNYVTNYNFKKCVRIIKNMREEMEKYGYSIPEGISSFGLESLLWNVDTSAYTRYSSILRYTFDEVLQYLRGDFSNYRYYSEANGIKPLFSGSVSPDDYHRFIKDLCGFYEYDIN